jgi:uncharacterized protein (DUF983 family)
MRVSHWQIFTRGLRGACPNCGQRLVFGTGLRLREFCPAPGCHLRWQRSPGYFLGAMVWNYALTVALVLPLTFEALVAGWVSETVALTVAVLLVLVLPILIYPASWSLWLMSYYFFLPHELPANASELYPTRDDE